MKPPRKVKVGPHVYRIVTVPEGVLEGAGADGTCTPRRQVIAVDGGLPPSELADVLCHEITHALSATVPLDDAVNEAIALAFGPGLYAFIQDNPEFIDWIRSL